MVATVFSNDMVAHVWAQQRQPEGRSHNGNFYFNGRTLYSYGSHYPVGIFAGVGGPVFLNSSKSTPTTEGKHKNPARRAVQHLEAFHLPNLDDVADVIAAIRADNGASHRQALERYFAANWRGIEADNAGAQWLLSRVGSRATWSATRARYSAKAAADAATNAARLKASEARHGRELAALAPLSLRANAWRGAAEFCQRGLRESIRDYRAARLATPKAHKRVRATLWSAETYLRAVLASAERDSYSGGNPGRRTQARAAMGRLRLLRAGIIGHVPGFDGPDGAEKLAAALALPTGAGWRTLANVLTDVLAFAPMPPAIRFNMELIRQRADAIASEREGEESRRNAIRETRRRLLDDVKTFNANRRHLAAMRTAEGRTDRLLGRAIDSVLYYVPGLEPWGTRDGFAALPSLADRWSRVVRRAEEIADALRPEREELRTTEEREAAERAKRQREERERVARMTPDERREAWSAGELGNSDVRDLEYSAGPLLRARDAAIDGCSVTGGKLETSQGADVPLRHAFRVFQFVAACRAAGKAWRDGGTWGPRSIRVGHFRVDSVSASGDFVAGCHSIRWPEVERLAERLGVAGCLAPLPEAAERVAESA